MSRISMWIFHCLTLMAVVLKSSITHGLVSGFMFAKDCSSYLGLFFSWFQLICHLDNHPNIENVLEALEHLR